MYCISMYFCTIIV